MVDKTAEGNIEMTVIDVMVLIEVGIDQGERPFSRIYCSNRARSASNSSSRSGSRASTNKDRIGCYNCRAYGHFTRDCPTSKKREI